ncbi:hypothetical protein AAY81_04810 [Denitrobacterium detoxificans]|nr:hypothetical protein [Denitrobacterium detoxificans]ANE22557.1 hypothetical protein AAY81_04810 [Denitrobacterium detoxificans]
MFGRTPSSGNTSGHDNETSSAQDLLRMAGRAYDDDRLSQAAHLYIAAFDSANQVSGDVEPQYVEGLRRAWNVACKLKERALAEYVFEKLEPYATGEETARNAEALQSMALEKLEEFGFSHDEVQDMSELLGVEPSSDDDSSAPEAESFTYADLIGYDKTIKRMRERGIGMGDDGEFSEFMEMLHKRHGLESIPSVETILFRSKAREDANRFMVATAGELGLPVVRMFMDESPQGYPVLCIMTSREFRGKARFSRLGFQGPAVLMLENIDLWGAPVSVDSEDGEASFTQQLTRGAREAVNFIRASVEHPDVWVLASCSEEKDLEAFFYDILDPVDIVQIDTPGKRERAAIWQHACALFPSLRFLDRDELISYSKHMTRFDMYTAARHAVEQAYNESIRKRVYVPVTRENLYEKIASYQPLESKEYRALEDTLVDALRVELDKKESDFLGKGGK